MSFGICRADDLSRIVAACGKPNHDDSTLHDNPRPPLVTRFIDYDRAHLRLAFLLNPHERMNLGAPPHRPYQWGLIGFLNVDHPHPIEEGGDRAISAYEGAERLKTTCKAGFVPPTPIVGNR
jgi:hypothetical protein